MANLEEIPLFSNLHEKNTLYYSTLVQTNVSLFRASAINTICYSRYAWGGGYRDSLLETVQEAVTIACTRVHR